MESSVTPNPVSVKTAIQHIKEVEARKTRELDKLIDDLHEKVFTQQQRPEPAKVRHPSPREQRDRVHELKNQGLSGKEISEVMKISEIKVRLLLKPYEPKPHLTQKIEGLEDLRRQISKQNHPAGKHRKHNKG